MHNNPDFDSNDIHNRFSFHPGSPMQAPVHATVRFRYKVLAFFMDTLLPESREKSLALSRLQESMMWANAAVAMTEPASGQDQCDDTDEIIEWVKRKLASDQGSVL